MRLKSAVCTIAIALLHIQNASSEIVASTDWRASGSGGAMERSFVFQVDDGVEPMLFEPKLPGPGYVKMTVGGLLPADSLASVGLLVGSENRQSPGTYRLPLPDDVQLEVDGGNIFDAGEITLVWRPELDIAEPNDDLLLGWPVEPGELVEGVLYPVGDVDYFSFDLEYRSIMKLEASVAPGRLNYAFFDPDGNRVRDNGPAELPAGTNTVAVWYYDRNFESTDAYEFSLRQRILPDPDLTPAEPEPLRAGRKSVLSNGESGNVERKVIVDEPGLYTISYSNIGNSVSMTWVNEQGEELRSNGAFLKKGEYTLKFSGVSENPGRPRIISLYRQEKGDVFEPNDFRSDAADLKPGLNQEIWFDEESPVDFYNFMPDKTGVLTIVAKPKTVHCQGWAMWQYPDGMPESRTPVGATFTTEGPRFGPVPVTKGEPTLIEMYCGQFNGDYGYSLDIEIKDAAILDNTTRDETPIYIVGLELSDRESLGLATAAEEAGVSFINSSEGESLAESISVALDASQNFRTPINLPIRLILVLLVLAAGVGFSVYLSVFRKKSKSDAKSAN